MSTYLVAKRAPRALGITTETNPIALVAYTTVAAEDQRAAPGLADHLVVNHIAPEHL